MLQASPPVRRRHRLAWLFFLLALIEAAVIVAFAANRAIAMSACTAVGALATVTSQPVLGTASGAPLAAPPQNSMPSSDATMPVPSSDATTPLPEATQTAQLPSAAPAVTATDPASTSGDVHVQGDTDQIVDPKCAANAAVAALQASSPPTGPTCGPMKQPDALKAAEKQISR